MDDRLLAKRAALIEEIIYSYLPEGGAYDSLITDAVSYSVKAGGKRLRPLIMQETWKMFSGCYDERSGCDDSAADMLHAFMAAIEFIHTYSLVHDDLPAMDNDDLRRGKPTTHKVYGEAFGVLAGDALLNLAFETIASAMSQTEDAGLLKRAVKAFQILASRAGIRGMIGGQCLDVYTEKTEGSDNDLDEIRYIYENKTGALLEASCMIGAVLAGASSEELQVIEEFASHVGMAFQIRDDILDITSTEEVLGKPVGSDEKNQKQTYVTLTGLERSQQDVEKETELAYRCLDKLPFNSSFLRDLAGYLINREK